MMFRGKMPKLLVFLAVIQGLCYVHSKVVTAPKVVMNDGWAMPAIALGTWLGNNSQGRITPSANEMELAVQWALEAGYRHIDTAHIYQTEQQWSTANKELLHRAYRILRSTNTAREVMRLLDKLPRTPMVGKGLKASGVKREDVFITTKLWNDRHARSAVVPALRKSLEALGLEYVDLYLIHWPVGQFANGTYDTTDYLETWRGMMEAKALNLTRSIGLSNFNQQMMDRIAENHLEMPAALQVEINLNLQQPALLAYCRQHNITVMGYTPFGSLLPNKASPNAPPPRVDTPELVAIAQRYNKTVPQVALRYLHELGVVPLPKSLTKSRIEQNIDIFDFSLSAQDKELLRSYDRGHRTIPQDKWRDHPYYPFEKAALA